MNKTRTWSRSVALTLAVLSVSSLTHAQQSEPTPPPAGDAGAAPAEGETAPPPAEAAPTAAGMEGMAGMAGMAGMVGMEGMVGMGSSSAEEAALLAELMAAQGDVDAPAAGAAEGNKLEIYGFADFNYRHWLLDEDSNWIGLFEGENNPQFFVGNLNVYMRKALDARWDYMSEVRFHFSPHGSTQIRTNTDTLTDPTLPEFERSLAQDPVEFGRTFSWGGIEIERVHLTYAPLSWLSVRFGRFLSPYGVWNIDHGSPTLVGANRPYIIGDALIPEAQTGIEFFGGFSLGPGDFGYHLTVSNGRGPVERVYDLDGNKALGYRLVYEFRPLGLLVLGTSGYYGTYTETRRQLNSQEGPPIVWVEWERYDELSLAADLRWEYNNLYFVNEVLSHQRAWNDDARAPVFSLGPSNGQQPDSHRWGFYSLIGYRLPWWGIMPVYLFQYYDIGQVSVELADSSKNMVHQLGFQMRIVPPVVLKVYGQVGLFNAKEGGTGDDPLYTWYGILAWSF